MLAALTAGMPNLQAALRKEYGPQAETELELARKYTPEFAKVQAEALQGPGRELAKIGRELSAEEQKGAAQTELDIARGVGRDIAGEALSLQKLVEPEYFKAREGLLDQIEKGFAQLDPSQLTKGEEESVARGLGRTAWNVGSPMQTAKNAMTFGDALRKRRAEHADFIGRVGGLLPGLRTGITGFEAATRRTLMPNFGTANYTGIQQPGISQVNQQGSNLMSSATQFQNQALAKQESGLDKFTKVMDASGKLIGGIAGGVMGGI